jgi:hypothetical protein
VGPVVEARAFSRRTKSVALNPKRAAETPQYLRKSRRVISILYSSSFLRTPDLLATSIFPRGKLAALGGRAICDTPCSNEPRPPAAPRANGKAWAKSLKPVRNISRLFIRLPPHC